MNRRMLKCGYSYIAIGEQGSIADLQAQIERCTCCDIRHAGEHCEYMHLYDDNKKVK